MKKALAFLVVGFVFFGSCSVQNAYAQSSNDAQRIVGTWVLGNGSSYIFDANGTYSYTSSRDSSFNSNGKYFISGSKIIMKISDSDDAARAYDFYISTNGRILAINWSGSDSSWYEKK